MPSRGRPLSTEEYYERLAGLSDPEIVDLWLGPGHDDVVARKIDLYRVRAGRWGDLGQLRGARGRARGRRARPGGRRVGASARVEVEMVLVAAGLSDAVSRVVAAEDVEHGKPAPDGYLRALELLEVAAEDAVAVEDSRRRGRRRERRRACIRVAVTGTTVDPRPARGRRDETVRLDPGLVRRLIPC